MTSRENDLLHCTWLYELVSLSALVTFLLCLLVIDCMLSIQPYGVLSTVLIIYINIYIHIPVFKNVANSKHVHHIPNYAN